MTAPQPARRYRFGVFEADAVTGELRRQGIRIKLNAQPFQVLCLLMDRPGQLLTREEISRELWPSDTFVDCEHGVNSAVNRIREALGDTAGNPRFIETLARRGYRFVAPVELISPDEKPSGSAPPSEGAPAASSAIPEAKPHHRFLASPEDLPQASHSVARTLFLLLQLMYLGFYVGALANLAEIDELFSPLPQAAQLFIVLIVTAAILIPVRAFLLCAVLFQAPGTRDKILKIWPFLLVFDLLWSLAPFLLLHHINFGVALACTTLLVYSPFAQRALVLMGASDFDPSTSASLR
jgi:DNA-binding winged helix-turn-helix (wHTH) protein